VLGNPIRHAIGLRVLIETKVRGKRSARMQREVPHRWHAVTIIGPATACAAAQACKGKRYLSRDAPRLPLAGCDAERCDCKYRHFGDRRGTPRRAEEKGAAPARVATNRRGHRGRRETD
jgi:hypothetical protein